MYIQVCIYIYIYKNKFVYICCHIRAIIFTYHTIHIIVISTFATVRLITDGIVSGKKNKTDAAKPNRSGCCYVGGL